MQKRFVNNREEAKAVLESNGGLLHYHAWTFCGSCYCCGEGCCDSIEESVDDALNTLESFCDGNWNLVEVDE